MSWPSEKRRPLTPTGQAQDRDGEDGADPVVCGARRGRRRGAGRWRSATEAANDLCHYKYVNSKKYHYYSRYRPCATGI
uniref:Uncharacterized protein n=1 Tax=Oryza glumipatula TaxID=40148 RepID=A0A0D9ZSY7_9ORYZ